MLGLLVGCVGAALDPCHSLTPPFLRTGLSEIGNWTLTGAAVAKKSAIFLTSKVSYVSGGVCSRVPTFSEDWISDISIKSRGERIIFLFSRTVCPNHNSRFISGFNISLVNNDETNKTVITIEGEEIFIPQTCEFIENEDTWRIRIEKRGQNVTVTTGSRPCFTQKVSSNNNFGYFSIWADSGECNDCMTQIHSFDHFTLSPSVNFISSDILERNRKTIDQNTKTRAEMKMKRRGQMLTVSKYVGEERNSGGILLDSPVTDFRDAFREASELISRARECVTIENLSSFVNQKVIPVIDKAAARFERVSDSLWHMRCEMTDLLDRVQRDLRSVNEEFRIAREQIEYEAIDVLKTHKILELDLNNTKLTASAQPIIRILLMIVIIEVVLFLPLACRVIGRRGRRHLFGIKRHE